MSNTVVYTFGRLNPITAGHEKLIDRVVSVAKEERGDAHIFISPSHDSKKNPLKFEQRLYFLKKMYPKVYFNTNKKLNNPYAPLGDLVKKYDHIIFIVGGDRIEEMSKLESFFVKNIQKDYPEKTIELKNAGERAALRVGNEDISGTFMRKYATANDYETFRKGLPKKMKDADGKKLFNQVRAGMGLV